MWIPGKQRSLIKQDMIIRNLNRTHNRNLFEGKTKSSMIKIKIRITIEEY